MKSILLLGDFRELKPVLSNLKGYRYVSCHSYETLRNEWSRHQASALAIALKALTPSVLEGMGRQLETWQNAKGLIFVQQSDVLLDPYNNDRLLYFQGQPQFDWSPRIQRWLHEGDMQARRVDRRKCRGGVRLKTSDYSRSHVPVRAFGELVDLGPQGVGMMMDGGSPFPAGEFVELAMRDPKGMSRSFHAQIRWMRTNGQETRLGLQFLAAISGGGAG
jgi:hypothetical protein